MAAKNVAALLFLITAHGFHTSLCMKETHHQVLLSLEQGKTNAAACDFPEYLELHMKSQKPFRGSMILRRKDEIDTDAPAYIIRTRENGVVNFVKQENRLTAKSAVAYQSSEFGAAFLAKCGDGSFRLEGTMYIEGKKYRVKPAYEREGRSYGDPGSHVYVFSFVKETVHNDLQLQSLYGMRKLNIETINASRHTPEGHQH